MITLKNTIYSVLLMIALSFMMWTVFVPHEKKSGPSDDEILIPDAYMINVVATVMNKHGTPALKIITPKMTHYPNQDSTDIEKPTVIVYRQSPKPWTINSDFAKATYGLSEIDFWSHVIIHHDADLDNPTTTMQTTTLTVYPDKQTAQTDQAITITQPDSTVRAIGMLADMNQGTVKLLSQAQGEYDPTT